MDRGADGRPLYKGNGKPAFWFSESPIRLITSSGPSKSCLSLIWVNIKTPAG